MIYIGLSLSLLKVCLPVVIFGAPFGAFAINQIGRKTIASILIAIIIIQFITAIAIIQPSFKLIIFSTGIFLLGVTVFFLLTNFKLPERRRGNSNLS